MMQTRITTLFINEFGFLAGTLTEFFLLYFPRELYRGPRLRSECWYVLKVSFLDEFIML